MSEKPAETIRRAAALMREQHGPEHVRHQFWHALASWGANPRIEILGSTEAERLAAISFGVRHRGRLLHANFIVALLSDLFGIQARSGCFCAGPYIHRLYGIDDRWSDRMSAQAVKGQMGALLSFTRVSFNYFISEPTFAYILDAIHLIADDGWKLLPLYRFDSATGLWRHHARTSDSPQSLRDVLTATPAPPATAPESALTGQIGAARRIIADLEINPPSGPLVDSIVSPEFERIRWFPLPAEALRQLPNPPGGN